jgi:hypothetical protein
MDNYSWNLQLKHQHRCLDMRSNRVVDVSRNVQITNSSFAGYNRFHKNPSDTMIRYIKRIINHLKVRCEVQNCELLIFTVLNYFTKKYHQSNDPLIGIPGMFGQYDVGRKDRNGKFSIQKGNKWCTRCTRCTRKNEKYPGNRIRSKPVPRKIFQDNKSILLFLSLSLCFTCRN